MTKIDANDIHRNHGPDELRRTFDHSFGKGRQNAKTIELASIDWPDPDMSVVQGARIAPPKLDLSLFGSLAPMLKRIAEHKGAPTDASALALLVSASALIGVKRRVRPWPGWNEPTMLWGGLVMPPSQNKSPVLAPFREAFQAAEDYLSRDFGEKHRNWEADRKTAELAPARKWESDVEEAIKGGYMPPPLPQTAEVPPEPLKPRLWVGDITAEKAAELLANRPGGFLVYRDELSGWLASMGRYTGGNGSDRAFWLETYNGDRFRCDRKNAGEIDIPHAAAAVLGGIQPDQVKDLALMSQRDGLSARFLWVYPDPCRQSARKVISRLPRVLTKSLSGWRPYRQRTRWMDHFRPVDLPLTEDGAATFQLWRLELDKNTRGATGLYAEALGKYGGNLLRIACVLEHLNWAASEESRCPETISTATLNVAMRLLDEWAKPHLVRVLGEAGSPRVDTNAATLARYLLSKPCEKFNASIVRRKQNWQVWKLVRKWMAHAKNYWKQPGFNLAENAKDHTKAGFRRISRSTLKSTLSQIGQKAHLAQNTRESEVYSDFGNCSLLCI